MSLLALTMELCGYGYIRIIILMEYIIRYWNIYDIQSKVCIITLYMLGIMWIYKIGLQYKHMIGNIMDIYY